MSTLFYRYARLSILAVFLLTAAGLGAFFSLGRQEDPTLTERFGIIVTPFPGASAERVEALITDPLEESVQELAEIDETGSTSRSGVSIISMTMREDLSALEVDQGWTKIREQVDAVRPFLPAGSGAPDVQRQYIGAATIIVSLSWPQERGAPNMAILSRLGRDLERELGVLDGTEETAIFGEVSEEVRVLADPDTLAAIGLSVPELAGLIARADARAPAGALRSRGVDLNVEVDGALDGLDRVRAIAVGESPDGDFIRVGDIARVEKGVRTPVDAMAVHDGDRTVFVAAYLQPDLRVDQWTRAADAVIADFAASAPGVEIEVIFRQSDYVESRLNGLALNLAFSALIVFAVLFLTMGWRAAFIVGSALPLTVLFVLFLLRVFDEPLHQMSVTGLVVALGLLIDNAIVVVDEYQLMRRRGHKVSEALDKAVRHLFAPLLASTLTTVFAFSPIALMPGAAGEFIGMIGTSVIFAVSASFILAMTVIPAFAAWFDDSKIGEGRNSLLRNGLRSNLLARGYRLVLDGVRARPAAGILAGLVLPIAGFWAASTLPMQFFPPTDRDMFQLEIALPASTSIEETHRQTERATALIEGFDGVEEVSWVIGESAPRVYYNVVANQSGAPNFAAGFVRTESAEATARILPELQRLVLNEFPEARFLTLPFEQGPPTPAPIEFIIAGPELAVLDDLGDQIRGVLARTPNVTHTVALLETGEPVARLMADEASAELAGLRLADLADRLRGDFDGVVGGSVLEGVEELPVRVIVTDETRASLASVGAAPLATPGGPLLAAPVAVLGEVELAPEVASIRHEDGRRVNTIYAYLEPFRLPASALEHALAEIDAAGIEMPPGYELKIGGEAEARGDATGNLFSTALPLLILMLGSVVLAFNSFRYALVIFCVGALSVGLAMFGVWLFNTPLGFNAIVGAMGLVGLSINGSIVVLSALKTNPAALALEEGAVQDTVMDATRHIVSTTLTTIGGFTPLILSGDSFWLPFAAAMAGGVAGSALLALLFAPAAFIYLAKIERHKRRIAQKVKARLEREGGLMEAGETA